jgi:hypothetical protein
MIACEVCNACFRTICLNMTDMDLSNLKNKTLSCHRCATKNAAQTKTSPINTINEQSVCDGCGYDTKFKCNSAKHEERNPCQKSRTEENEFTCPYHSE